VVAAALALYALAAAVAAPARPQSRTTESS